MGKRLGAQQGATPSSPRPRLLSPPSLFTMTIVSYVSSPHTHTQTHTQGPAATREVLGEPVGGSSAALGPRGARRPTTLCPSQLGSSSQHAVHSGHHDVLRHSTCPRGPVSQEKTNVDPASDGLDSHRELPWGTLPLPDGVGAPLWVTRFPRMP